MGSKQGRPIPGGRRGGAGEANEPLGKSAKAFFDLSDGRPPCRDPCPPTDSSRSFFHDCFFDNFHIQRLRNAAITTSGALIQSGIVCVSTITSALVRSLRRWQRVKSAKRRDATRNPIFCEFIAPSERTQPGNSRVVRTGRTRPSPSIVFDDGFPCLCPFSICLTKRPQID